jgi:hypothetical protein
VSNFVPGDATVIPSLPYGIVQSDIDAAPTDTGNPATCFTDQYHAVWYTYTTGDDEIVIAIVASPEADLNSLPTFALYTGTVGSLTQYTLGATDFCGSSVVGGDTQMWFKVPVTPATQYFLQIIDANDTSDPATLTLGVLGTQTVHLLRNAALCVVYDTTSVQVVNARLGSTLSPILSAS